MLISFDSRLKLELIAKSLEMKEKVTGYVKNKSKKNQATSLNMLLG